MSLRGFKTREQQAREAAEIGRKAAERLREDRRLMLIYPFEPEKFLSRSVLEFYDPTDFESLARSLPEMRQLLEELKNEVQADSDKLSSQQIAINQIETKIAQTDFGAVELEVSEALRRPLKEIEVTEFLLETGGEVYIGLTHTTVEDRISDLLHQADNGAMDRVSTQLRRFGHIYKSKIIEIHQTEIHGLVGQFISIKKYSASLNEPSHELDNDTGLQTQNYRLIEKLNSSGEEVLAVVSIKNEEMKRNAVVDEKQSSDLQIKIQKMKDEIRELKNSIAKLEPYEAQEPEIDC